MESMEQWWNSLSTELQVFYAVGIAGTFFLLIQTVLLIIGFGDDSVGGADDADVDIDETGDIRLVSTKTIVAFAVGFGWSGVICLKNGFSIPLTVLIAMFVGSFLMVLVLYLMKSLYGLRSSGNINYENAVGTIATVYVPIPPNQSGPGQVEISIQGRVRFVQAFTDATERIASNTRVKVVDLVDPVTLLVQPLSSTQSEET